MTAPVRPGSPLSPAPDRLAAADSPLRAARPGGAARIPPAGPTPPWSKRTWAFAAGLVLLSFAVFWLSPVRKLSDSHYSMLLSESLIRTRSFYLDQYFVPPLDPDRYPTLTDDGYPYQLNIGSGRVLYRYPPGTSLLSIPFVAAMNALGVSSLGSDGGYDQRAELLIQALLASLLMAALTAVFYLTARLLLPENLSLAVAVAGGFGSQVWASASRVLWSHTWETLLLGLVVLLLVGLERGVWKLRPVLLATLVGWACYVRPSGLVVLLTVSGYLLLCRRRQLPAYLLACAVWLALFVTYSQLLLDKPAPGYYAQDSLAPDAFLAHLRELFAPLAGLLVSPSRGLLVFLPWLLFVVYLLVRGGPALPLPRLAALALATVLLHLVALARWQFWWGGHSYGPRLLTELVPWFVLLGIVGLASARERAAALSSGALRTASLEILVGTCLLILSILINSRGALSEDVYWWNIRPVDVDVAQDRLWDWSQPQFLVGIP